MRLWSRGPRALADTLEGHLEVEELGLRARDGLTRHHLEELRVGVAHKDLRVVRLEHNHFDGGVRLQLLGEHGQVREHGEALDVDRGVVEGGPRDRALDLHFERGEAAAVGH